MADKVFTRGFFGVTVAVAVAVSLALPPGAMATPARQGAASSTVEQVASDGRVHVMANPWTDWIYDTTNYSDSAAARRAITTLRDRLYQGGYRGNLAFEVYEAFATASTGLSYLVYHFRWRAARIGP